MQSWQRTESTAAKTGGFDPAAREELKRLRELRSFAQSCEEAAAHANAAVAQITGTRDAADSWCSQVHETVRQLGNLQAIVASQPAWAAPQDVGCTEDLKGATTAALKVLEELEAAVQGLGPLKAALHRAGATASMWEHLIASHKNRWHNEHAPGVALLRLPQTALRSIAHHVGKEMRTVCSQIYHAYGSPGSGVLVWLGAGPNRSSGGLARMIKRWPAPWEVEKLWVAESLQTDEMQLLAASFPKLQEMRVPPVHHSSNLPAALTKLVVDLPAALRDHPMVQRPAVQLEHLAHLRLLRSLELRECHWQPGTLDPLVCLSCLTALSLCGPRSGAAPAAEQPITPEAWAVLSQLPQLQELDLRAPLTLDRPLPSNSAKMPALRCLTLEGTGGGLLQRYVTQVFELFPEGLNLNLLYLDYAFTYEGAEPAHLSQALGRLRCRSLLVDLAEEPVAAAQVTACLQSAVPYLDSLVVEVNSVPDLGATFFSLVQEQVPLRSLSISYLGELDPIALLNSVTPNLPHLTSLALWIQEYTSPVAQPSFASSLSNLKELRINGYNLMSSFATQFSMLTGLTSLDLLFDFDHPFAAHLRHHLPHCYTTALTLLSSLEVLNVQSPRIAANPADHAYLPAPLQGNEGTDCWLGLVKQLPRLRELALYTSHKLAPDEVTAALPLPSSLTCILLEYAHDDSATEWPGQVFQVLKGHVDELCVRPWLA